MTSYFKMNEEKMVLIEGVAGIKHGHQGQFVWL